MGGRRGREGGRRVEERPTEVADRAAAEVAEETGGWDEY